MLIDCETCLAPAAACGDCVMTTLLQIEPRPVEIDDAERDAIDSLAAAGLVPPLRLVIGVVSGFDDQGCADDGAVHPASFRAVAPEMSGKRWKARGIA